MALNKQELKSKIKQLLEDMLVRDETSTDEFAERLSTAIDDYVRRAQINYTGGLTAPNGAVAGIFNGNLS